MEERKHPRAKILIEVNYRNLDTFYRNTVLNISQGGMFIRTRTLLPLGTEIALEFTLPGQEEKITSEGIVVWIHRPTTSKISSSPFGMGIRFRRMHPRDLKRIRDYVEEVLRKQPPEDPS